MDERADDGRMVRMRLARNILVQRHRSTSLSDGADEKSRRTFMPNFPGELFLAKAFESRRSRTTTNYCGY